MSLPLEDYALIGDCHTAALVSRQGSIDWLCLPRFDAPACFAALLGNADHGHWQLAPADKTISVRRRYVSDTMVLETEFTTASGVCRVVDFMPMGWKSVSVVRIATCLRGHVDMGMTLAIRFDYGVRVPWVTCKAGELRAIAGADQLLLRTTAPLRGKDFLTVSEFRLEAEQSVSFVLSHGPSHMPPPPPVDAEKSLRDTCNYWSDWAGKCNYDGVWRAAVVRSLLTLKALTYRQTGSIIAAPTTSLPEKPGGKRNWDYRYCWLRDATFTLLAMIRAGYRDEADAWRGWLERAVAGLPSQLQPVYGPVGNSRLDELELPWLPGYAGSQPVRVGNKAFAQLQLDAFGEVLDALHHARRADLSSTPTSWALQCSLLDYLEGIRDQPDCGIWEFRGEKQYFTHSRVMTWVAFDRGVSAVQDFGLDGPVGHWEKLRDELHAEICDRAFDPQTNAFMQSYGSKQLDAAVLLLPLVGFLPATDPRMIGTVKAIERDLLRNGFVYRYDTDLADDGLEPNEGALLACSFWYIDNLVLQGRRDEGRRMFERLLSIRNDVGLLSEEFDSDVNRLVGNFPQALSHLALVDTAFNLLDRRGPAHERGKHGD